MPTRSRSVIPGSNSERHDCAMNITRCFYTPAIMLRDQNLAPQRFWRRPARNCCPVWTGNRHRDMDVAASHGKGEEIPAGVSGGGSQGRKWWWAQSCANWSRVGIPRIQGINRVIVRDSLTVEQVVARLACEFRDLLANSLFCRIREFCVGDQGRKSVEQATEPAKQDVAGPVSEISICMKSP